MESSLTSLCRLFDLQSSYNFRTYFLRRSRDMFPCQSPPRLPSRSILPFLQARLHHRPRLPFHPALTGNHPSTGGFQRVDLSSLAYRREKLSKFYNTALEDLKVLQRSALMNRMYEGEKLVVEKPRLIMAVEVRERRRRWVGVSADVGPAELGRAPPSG